MEVDYSQKSLLKDGVTITSIQDLPQRDKIALSMRHLGHDVEGGCIEPTGSPWLLKHIGPMLPSWQNKVYWPIHLSTGKTEERGAHRHFSISLLYTFQRQTA